MSKFKLHIAPDENRDNLETDLETNRARIFGVPMDGEHEPEPKRARKEKDLAREARRRQKLGGSWAA